MLRLPCSDAWRWIVGSIAAQIALGAALACHAGNPSSLVADLAFEDLRQPEPTGTVNRASEKMCAVRGGTSAPGVAGLGLKMTGQPDQAVDLGVLGFNQPATLALWIKRAATPTADPSGVARPEYLQEHDRGQGRLLSRTAGKPDKKRAGSLRVGPNGLQLWNGPGWITLIAAPIPAETWVHIAVVFDEQMQATGYLNGRAYEPVHSGFDGEPLPMALFASSGDNHYGFPFAGCADEIRLYHSALTPSEIAALAVPPKTDASSR